MWQLHRISSIIDFFNSLVHFAITSWRYRCFMPIQGSIITILNYSKIIVLNLDIGYTNTGLT